MHPGSRYVADLTKVDRYSYVMHPVSRVVGELRHDPTPCTLTAPV
ncbi:hypothetical protein ECZU34_01920 [Escherichia coli]|nr:hypothetical protein ECZU34_01920 [Escherichia coli]